MCVIFSLMKEYTTKEAALIIGVSDRQIRKLAAAGDIDHKYFGRVLVITELGITQARERKTKPGPAKKTERRKAA